MKGQIKVKGHKTIMLKLGDLLKLWWVLLLVLMVLGLIEIIDSDSAYYPTPGKYGVECVPVPGKKIGILNNPCALGSGKAVGLSCIPNPDKPGIHSCLCLWESNNIKKDMYWNETTGGCEFMNAYHGDYCDKDPNTENLKDCDKKYNLECKNGSSSSNFCECNSDGNNNKMQIVMKTFANDRKAGIEQELKICVPTIEKEGSYCNLQDPLSGTCSKKARLACIDGKCACPGGEELSSEVCTDKYSFYGGVCPPAYKKNKRTDADAEEGKECHLQSNLKCDNAEKHECICKDASFVQSDRNPMVCIPKKKAFGEDCTPSADRTRYDDCNNTIGLECLETAKCGCFVTEKQVYNKGEGMCMRAKDKTAGEDKIININSNVLIQLSLAFVLIIVPLII